MKWEEVTILKGEQKCRLYHCALHSHMDSLLTKVDRDMTSLNYSGVDEVPDAYEPAEHVADITEPADLLDAFEKKTHEVNLSCRHIIQEGSRKIWNASGNPIFQAKAVTAAVACASAEEIDSGLGKAGIEKSFTGASLHLVDQMLAAIADSGFGNLKKDKKHLKAVKEARQGVQNALKECRCSDPEEEEENSNAEAEDQSHRRT